jgi:hypothetical protein
VRDHPRTHIAEANKADSAHSILPMLEHDPERWIPVFRKDHALLKI